MARPVMERQDSSTKWNLTVEREEELQPPRTHHVLMRESDEDGIGHKGIVFQSEKQIRPGGANSQQRASGRDSWF